ncbi:hypothetical protein C7M84_005008 [Penaeus vannamei]|uniref:Uncharacterized protein n=1 Tax=Penaeus vannamei TaxID=6689 RepID=A0A423TIX8_PENVA|nr:hypothetical protein C7M84_005008 [Penaeus vannamei]
MPLPSPLSYSFSLGSPLSLPTLSLLLSLISFSSLLLHFLSLLPSSFSFRIFFLFNDLRFSFLSSDPLSPFGKPYFLHLSPPLTTKTVTDPKPTHLTIPPPVLYPSSPPPHLPLPPPIPISSLSPLPPSFHPDYLGYLNGLPSEACSSRSIGAGMHTHTLIRQPRHAGRICRGYVGMWVCGYRGVWRGKEREVGGAMAVRSAGLDTLRWPTRRRSLRLRCHFSPIPLLPQSFSIPPLLHPSTLFSNPAKLFLFPSLHLLSFLSPHPLFPSSPSPLPLLPIPTSSPSSPPPPHLPLLPFLSPPFLHSSLPIPYASFLHPPLPSPPSSSSPSPLPLALPLPSSSPPHPLFPSHPFNLLPSPPLASPHSFLSSPLPLLPIPYFLPPLPSSSSPTPISPSPLPPYKNAA